MMDLFEEQTERKPETPLTLLLKSPQKNALPSSSSSQAGPSHALAPSSTLVPILPPILDTRPTITLQ